jgi:hypothetical protein
MRRNLKRNWHKIVKKIKRFSSIDIFGFFIIILITSTIYFFFNRKVQYLDITIRLFNYEGPEYSIESNKPRPWYVNQIEVGKKQKGGLGETLIEIVDVYSYPGPSVYYDSYVTLRIRVAFNQITQQYIYDGSPLLIHDIRSFKIQDLLLSGEIVDMSANDPDYQKFEVSLELDPRGTSPLSAHEDFENNSMALVEGVKNYIADSLEEGMSIKDSKNTNLVKIKEIKTQPGGRGIAGPNGYFFAVDPERTKVVLVLEILGENINNHYYYRKDAPLAVGNNLHLMFDQVSTYGTITSLKPILEPVN